MANTWLNTLRAPLLRSIGKSVGIAAHLRAKSTSTRGKKVTFQTAKTVKAVNEVKTAKRDCIDRFFARFPEFHYKRSAPFLDEFKRLKEQEKWNEHKEKRERSKLQEAMVEQFTVMYGREENDLLAWQRLCHALGVKRIPKTLHGCQQLVTRTHVNLVDFIVRRDPGEEVRKFKSEDDLRTYTLMTEKFYDRKAAKRSSLLRRLLRRITD